MNLIKTKGEEPPSGSDPVMGIPYGMCCYSSAVIRREDRMCKLKDSSTTPISA